MQSVSREGRRRAGWLTWAGLLALSAASAAGAQARVLPAGSVIIVRTTAPLRSAAAQTGQTFEATVEENVGVDEYNVIPAGSRVRVERTTGGTLRGTLIKAGTDSITVQRNTRVPEPPVDILLGTVTRLTLDQGSSTGRNVAIGVASGVGATFGVLLILAAVLGGD